MLNKVKMLMLKAKDLGIAVKSRLFGLCVKRTVCISTRRAFHLQRLFFQLSVEPFVCFIYQVF